VSDGRTELLIVGGFLGSGKTTAIAGLARRLAEAGLKTGIVTNDQGSDLVDTAFLAREGLSVLEVTGGCFCCNFDEFTNRLSDLAATGRPDIILAEPVGSCTDLVATIFKPIQHRFTAEFRLRPLTVLADPARVRKLLQQAEGSGYPTEVNYLFEKQLEEADIIAISKIDTLAADERARLASFLGERFPGREIRAFSAVTGEGFAGWVGMLMNETERSGGRILRDIDYERYGAAEASLGWLNSRTLVKSREPGDFRTIVTAIMNGVDRALEPGTGEIAHLKVYAIADGDFTKASLVERGGTPRFERAMEKPAREALLLINARVTADPDHLRKLVDHAVGEVAREFSLDVSDGKTESFRPGFPKPSYRYPSI